MELFDLTRPMTPDTLVALAGRRSAEGWMVRPVEIEWLRSFGRGDWTAQATVTVSDHFGTHVDAPVHVIEGAAGTDEMDLSRLVGHAIVADCRRFRGHGLVSDDLAAIVPQHERGDVLLLCSDEPRGSLDRYVTDQTYVTEDGAAWIVEEGFSAVGVEASCLEHAYERIVRDHVLDGGTNNPWPAHRICLEADVYIIEGLTNLFPLAGERVAFSAAPLPFPGGSGSPVRAIAWRE